MSNDQRRITLLTQSRDFSDRHWNHSDEAGSRIVLLDSLAMLRSTIVSPLVRSESDVERIVLDRCTTESEYLSLLAELPHEFTGDVLMIREGGTREGGTSFLSATGRGGGRILYALTDEDVEFYLETVRLVDRTEEMERGVLKFRPREVRVADVRSSAGIRQRAVVDDREQSRQN
jgi:hypothetical protein